MKIRAVFVYRVEMPLVGGEYVWAKGKRITAALAHLAVSTPPEFLLNTTDLHNYQTTHFTDGAPEVNDGKLLVSDEPGLGVEPLAVYR